MAAHGSKPFVHVSDENGNPYVGAKLYVYEVGTTTLRSIYSDASLTTPISNPLSGVNASDAKGNFPRFYQASGTYKLRAVTSADVLIWEWDNIDTGIASGNPLAVANGGTGATTAAGARTNLGVAAQTEVDDLAGDIAALSATLQNLSASPQGYLTPTTGVPVITTGVTAGTALYYTPFVGNLIPIYNGTIFAIESFAELTLTLSASHVANAIYDAYVINDNGTIRLVTGQAWDTATIGSGARGTAQALNKLNGIWVNNAAQTMRNGASTYNVSQYQGTYVGTVWMDGTNGQITCHRAYGQSRKWSIWNAYNRQPCWLRGGDSNTSWSFSGSQTIRAQRGDTNNFISYVIGLPEVNHFIDLYNNVGTNSSGSAVCEGYNCICLETVSAFVGKVGYFGMTNANASNINKRDNANANYDAPVSIGAHKVIACETVVSAGASGVIFYSAGETGMLLKSGWVG